MFCCSAKPYLHVESAVADKWIFSHAICAFELSTAHRVYRDVPLFSIDLLPSKAAAAAEPAMAFWTLVADSAHRIEVQSYRWVPASRAYIVCHQSTWVQYTSLLANATRSSSSYLTSTISKKRELSARTYRTLVTRN